MTPSRLLSALALFISAASTAASAEPRHFIFIGGDSVANHRDVLSRPDIEGVQVVYSWRRLEPKKGQYDFSGIEADLKAANDLGADLFVQIQDRFFSPRARNIPRYLLDDPTYAGGLVRQADNAGEGEPEGQGWTTIQWNAQVRERFQLLLTALAEQFDGRLYGINLPESAIQIDQENDTTGFTCDGYVDASLENIGHAREAFQKTHVVQYVNFWPCEWNNSEGYMERTFKAAASQGFGLGGPDIIPHRRGQMKNSYPFFNQYQDELSLIAMAIQGPTLTYTNPKTGQKFTRDEFIDFADDYLGVDVIFWTTKAPWLQR